ncbi:MAG: Peptidyl-prolyl cis-trans isomerase [Burkholderiaceae bacterium]|nr:MAG: Peptidyl-prolyl cis-trans isomerase [Burkholderiaceae bacterium]
MKKQFVSAMAVMVAAAALALPAAAQNVAIVNGKPVPEARVDAFAQQLEASGRTVTPEIKAQIKNEVIAREVFAQAAQKLGLDATQNYKNQVELARQTILIHDLFENYQKTHPVTDAQAKAEYDKIVAASGAKEYHVHHILVENEDQAKSLIAQLNKGAKFEDLAKKYSKDPGSAAKGGDLDWAAPNGYVKEFSDAMMKLKKGQITETPVKTQFGYHIIRLDDVRDAKLPKFDDVKPQIVQQIEQQQLAAYQQELRSKAKVE